MLAAREEGALLREQAVLMRTGHDSDLLELELARRRIPFVKYGGLRYLEAAHVKDFLALLRLVDNPADEMSWFRVLQLLDGVGPARARRAVTKLVVGDAAGDALGGPAVGARASSPRARASPRSRAAREEPKRRAQGRAAARRARAAGARALPRLARCGWRTSTRSSARRARRAT